MMKNFLRLGIKKEGKLADKRPRTRPLRVIIGFLPEVNHRDALEYAEGLAEKYLEQMSLAYFEAFKFSNGYVYEIHEGGAGKAFFPEIEKFLEEHASDESPPYLVVGTATRHVQVELNKNGSLSTIVLPESTEKQPAEWLKGTSKMRPAISTRYGYLVVGAVMFVTGFSFMIVSSLLARYTPPAPERPLVSKVVNFNTLPSSRLPEILRVPPGKYIRKLEFSNGRWMPPDLGDASGKEVLPPPVGNLPAMPPMPSSGR